MKVTARSIGSSVRATARGIGQVMSRAYAMPVGVSAKAWPTEQSGVRKYLRVMPETPQQLIWLVPQYGIDYHVESNTDWKIV